MREGDEEEGMEVVLLKFGDELAKRGEERRLRLEFMGESEDRFLGKVGRESKIATRRSSHSHSLPAAPQFVWFSVVLAAAELLLSVFVPVQAWGGGSFIRSGMSDEKLLLPADVASR